MAYITRTQVVTSRPNITDLNNKKNKEIINKLLLLKDHFPKTWENLNFHPS